MDGSDTALALSRADWSEAADPPIHTAARWDYMPAIMTSCSGFDVPAARNKWTAGGCLVAPRIPPMTFQSLLTAASPLEGHEANQSYLSDVDAVSYFLWFPIGIPL